MDLSNHQDTSEILLHNSMNKKTVPIPKTIGYDTVS